MANLNAVRCLLLAACCAAAEPPVEYACGVLIHLEEPITPLVEQYFYRKLDTAKGQDADLVIVEIDSPGGYLDASLAIADRLRRIDWAHTVAYVPREALSGAAIVALGCDEIIMAPGAVLGDAGPIFQDEDFLFRHAPEKIRSDLARKIRDMAKARGRPPALAEAMVDMDLVVYRVRDRGAGSEAFMSEHEIDSDDDPARWEKIKPVLESRKGHFLEVNGVRAVRLGLAEGNVSGRDELLRRYRLKGELLILTPTAVDTAVYVLNLPLVTGLLFVVGLVALYVEFSVPGIGVGGLTAGLCFVLFFWSRFLGGTADWLEVILFAAGVVFLGVELFVLPGFGVAGLTGLLLLLASLILAGQDFIIPRTGRQLSTLAGTLRVVVASGGAFAVAAFVLSRYLGTIPILNRFTLAPPETADDDTAEAEQSEDRGELAEGDSGIADSPLRPAGRARFGRRYVDVVTDGTFITKGSRVEVVEIIGNRIVVREVDQQS